MEKGLEKLEKVLQVRVAELQAKIAAKPTQPAEPEVSHPQEPEWVKPPGLRLPKNGTWEGQPGNSNFIPDNPTELGLQPGDVIPFHQGYPDFSHWSKGNYVSDKPLTGFYNDDLKTMWQAIADAKNAANPDAGWTANKVRLWLQRERLSPHHAGGNEIQLIPWELHGNPSARPPIQGIRHTGGAYELRNQ